MADSVIAAALDKYATFTGVPDIYFGDAPPADGATQIYPPYVVLLDEGMSPQFEMEYMPLEPTELTFMVYSDTLAEVDAIVEIIKYNGGTPQQQLGFDFGSLPTLATPYKRMQILRTSERRFVASVGGTGKTGKRVHGCELRYQVTLFRYST